MPHGETFQTQFLSRRRHKDAPKILRTCVKFWASETAFG